MRFEEYPDREMMFIELAQRLLGEIKNCLLIHPWASFAVPGGTTPGPVFDALSAADIDWERVHVFLTDERWVPESSDRSNARLIRERLLQDKASAAQFLPFYQEDLSPEAAATALSEKIKEELPVSLMLLGMGDDGHTASLFPGAPELAAALSADAPAVMAVDAPGQPEPRMTLTYPVLHGAMSRHILITGASKREALERARKSSVEAAPVASILSGTTIHWAE